MTGCCVASKFSDRLLFKLQITKNNDNDNMRVDVAMPFGRKTFAP